MADSALIRAGFPPVTLIIQSILVHWILTPIVLGIFAVFARRSQRLVRETCQCKGCGFDLESIHDRVPRCPECGLEKDGHPVLRTWSVRTARRIDLVFSLLSIWILITVAVTLLAFLLVVLALRGGH
jgi:hypothetical protein